MALRQQSATLVEDFTYISLRDGAVDIEAKGFAEAWKKYRDGTGDPPLIEGEEPTVFTLRPITDADQETRLKGREQRYGRDNYALHVACAGIVGIDNLQGDDGTPMICDRVRVDGYDCLTKPLRDRITANVLAEIGMVLLTHKLPSPT